MACANYVEMAAGVVRADIDLSKVTFTSEVSSSNTIYTGTTDVVVPAGFVVTGMAVKEEVKATTGSNGGATLESFLGANEIGDGVTIGEATANAGVYNAGTARVVAADTKVKITLTVATANKPAAWTGKVAVAIAGFAAFLPAVSNTVVNKAGTDPMYA